MAPSISNLSQKLKNNYMGTVIIMIILITIYFIYIKLSNNYASIQNNEPTIIYGNHDGKMGKIVSGITFQEAANSKHGTELTYSFWLKINSWEYNKGKWKHLFHKGNDIGIPLQAPGFWLYPNENKLAINMNTYHSVKESCDIDNIPINKWINITFVLINKNIDIYVNGKLKKRCELVGLPKLNYGDLYMCQFGGFDGNISRFKYFNYALPIFRIENIFTNGPSYEEEVVSNNTKNNLTNLSNDWYNYTNMPNENNYPDKI